MFSAKTCKYTLAFAVLVLTSLSAIGHSQSSPWQSRAPMPTGRYGPPAAVIDGKLHMAAGCCLDPFSPFPARTNAHEVYDPVADSWATRAPMPQPWYGGASSVIGGKWYLAGGQPCCSNTDTLHIYDPVLDTWTTGAPMPRRTGGAMGAAIGSKLYIAGGMDPSNNVPVNDLRAYQPATNTWEILPPMLTARANGAAVAIEGKLYVVGGGDRTILHDALEIYDPLTGMWERGPRMPTARAGLAAAAFDGLLYAIGGDDNRSILDLVEAYDTSTRTWTMRARMPEAHAGPGVGVINGSLFVAGGYNGATPIGTANHAATLPLPIVVKGTPSIVLSGGTFTFDGQQHPVVLTATGASGETVAGRYSISYSPGGFAPPFNAGTYSAEAFFTSDDPYYNSTSASAANVVTIQKANAVVSATGGTFTYDGFQKQAFGSATGLNGLPVFGTFTLTYSPGGSQAPRTVGTYTVDVTFTPMDQSNYNGGTARTTIVINPSPATIFGPMSVTAEATGPSGGIPAFFVNAFDRDGPLTPECLPFGPGSVFPLGTTQVICTAQGPNSLPAGTSFPVRISDTRLPNIGSVSNVTVPATSSQGAVVTFDLPPVTDLVDPNPSVSASPAPGTLFPHGMTTVTVTARDASGNTATKSFTVTVSASLVSVSVAPASASMSPGGSRQFSASGAYTDGTTKVLSSGGSGGGNNSGPLNSAWQARFLDGFRVDACVLGFNQLGLASQAFSGNAAGVVDATWLQQLRVTGTITPAEVNLAIACTTAPGLTPATIRAVWTGTRYAGTLTGFSGSEGAVAITGWSSKGPMPAPRFALGAATLVVNGRTQVFAVAGASGSSLLNSVEAYDPALNTWTTVAPLPTAREGAGVVALNGRLYVVGGNVAGGSQSGIVEAFDPATGIWSTALPPLVTPRAHFSLVAAGGKLYAIGGDTAAGAATASVEVLDPSQASPAWTAAAAMPTGRRFTVAGALNNGATIVVAGGQQVNGPALDRVEILNVDANTWSRGPSMLAPSIAPAGAVISNALFVFGGTNNGPLVLSELYRPASGTPPNELPEIWAGLSGLPTPRSQAAAAVVGDVIYVIGGQGSGPNPQTGLSTLEAFSILSPDQFSSGGGSSGGGTPQVTWRLSPPTGVATMTSSGNVTGTAPGQVSVIAEAAGVSCQSTGTCGSLTVTNTRPSVAIFGMPSGAPEVTLEAGRNLSTTGSGSGSFFDSDPGQTWTATVDYGDGGGPTPLAIIPGAGGQGPTGRFNLDHVYRNARQFNVTVVVTDSFGDSSAAFLRVKVVDRTPPALSLPGNLSAEATSPDGAAVDFVASAMDGIDGPVGVTCSRAPGSTFPLGTTRVDCSTSDSSGNTARGGFDVTVRDTVAPAIAAVTPSRETIQPPNHKMVALTIDVRATDAADRSPACGITGVSSNETANGQGDGNSALDWQFTPGSLNLSLRAERSGGGNGRIYTITVSCADASGNRSAGSTQVKVPH